MTRTDARIDDLTARVDAAGAVEFLASLVRFKSYSGGGGEGEIARHLADAMDGLGLSVQLQEVQDGRYNAIGRAPGAGGGKSLLFNGHMDTNPVTRGWTVDPLAGLHDERFVYGIGVSNMKAGDAAYFWALKTLVDNGVRLRGDVILEYVVGELQGGIGTVKAIEEGVRADCFINAEPTDLAGLTLHAGAFDFEIELQGATRHVSKREEAVDAIHAACALVPRIDAMVFAGAASEAHRTVNRANVGVIRGSLTPEFHDWRPPQVADFVRLCGTARYAPSQSESGVLADLRTLLEALEGEYPGLRAQVRMAGAGERPTMLPFEAAHDSAVVRAVGDAYRRVRGTPQPLGAVRPYCYYGSDAAHLQHRAGMEGIVCGPGGRYNTMPDERVDIADYLDAIRIYLLAMLEICGVS